MHNINLAWTSNKIKWLEACSKASYGIIKSDKLYNCVDIDGNKNGTRSDGI